MRQKWIGLLVAVSLAAAGCATKEYVRQITSQTETRLDERLGTESRRAEEQGHRLDAQATRLEGHERQLGDAGARVARLETSTDEAGNIAGSARARADEAYGRAEDVNTRLSRFLASRHQRTLVESVNVHFGFDRADLDDSALTALAGLVKELGENPSLVVDLEGYSDAQGASEHNVQLSERRVAAVRRYLLQHGVELSRVNWIGLGELADTGSKAGRVKNRRVTIRLLLPADEVVGARRGASAPVDGLATRRLPSGAEGDETRSRRSIPGAPAEVTRAQRPPSGTPGGN